MPTKQESSRLIVDEVIAAGGDDHETKNIRRVRRQEIELPLQNLRGGAAGNRQVGELEVREYGTQTDAVHPRELVRRGFDEPVKIGIAFAGAEPRRDAIAQPHEQNPPGGPNFGKCCTLHGRTRRSGSGWPREPEKKIRRSAADQYQTGQQYPDNAPGG